MRIKDSKEDLEKLFEKINSFIVNYSQTDSKKVGSVSGSAILAGIDSINDIGGRVLVFTCNPCIAGFGGSKPREDSKLINTELEKNLYLPQNNAFVKLSEDIAEKRIAVDLFVFGNNQFDLSNFSPICNNTGGSCYFYNIDNKCSNDMKHKFDKLHYNLTRILTRENFYDVKFMLRHSLGFEVLEILGPFTKRLGTGLSLPSCDPDLSFSFIMRINDNLKPESRYHFQLVALYVDNFNQRYLRVLNYTLFTTNDISK